MKPVMYGYQAVRAGTSPAETENGRRLLAAYAAGEGYALAQIYQDRNPARPLSAFDALIAAARHTGVAAVAVPALEDLGRLPRVRKLMLQRLEREAGVRVLVVQPLDPAPQDRLPVQAPGRAGPSSAPAPLIDAGCLGGAGASKAYGRQAL